MDSIFHLSEDARAAFLQQISQTCGCTFICLWTYLPLPSNCLLFMDGFYHEENKQPSLSSGITRAMRLFNEYQKSVIIVDDGRAPGLAFKNNLPYIEFKEFDLQTVASTEIQLQFYQEARIKKAIYMGCEMGEIELGMSIDNQANIEMIMRNLFPDDFPRQAIPVELSQQPNDQFPHSSSSSSMRSLSVDSSEGTPSNFLYNISNNTSTSYNIPEPPLAPSGHETLMSQIRSVYQFPKTMIEREDAAMAHAMLAVISSSSPASSTNSHQTLQKASAFKSYRPVLSTTSQIKSRIHRQNMLKRAIAFCRSNANLMPASQEQTIQYANRPTSNQMHHMISERKRREKLNESFQALRSLLPPGSKKDKASLLSNTTEYITSLKAEVEELTTQNQTLEAQILQGSSNDPDLLMASTFLTDQTHHVWITNTSESTSEGRNLSIIVRGDYCSMLDLSIRVVEFLKQLRYVSLLSLQADMPMVEAASLIRLVFRLKIEEGSEWDERAFQEAVTSVVADLAS